MKMVIYTLAFIGFTCCAAWAGEESLIKQLSSDDLVIRKSAAQALLSNNKVDLADMSTLIAELGAAQSVPDKQKFLLSFIIALQDQLLIQDPASIRHAPLKLKEDVSKTMRQIINNEDHTVKEYAYIMLGLYEVNDASEDFLAYRYGVEDVDAKACVIRGIGYTELGSAKARGALMSALDTNDPRLFEEACGAVVRANFKEGISKLISRLSDKDAQIAESAVSSLEKFPETEVSRWKEDIGKIAAQLPEGELKERIIKMNSKTMNPGD